MTERGLSNSSFSHFPSVGGLRTSQSIAAARKRFGRERCHLPAGSAFIGNREKKRNRGKRNRQKSSFTGEIIDRKMPGKQVRLKSARRAKTTATQRTLSSR